MRWKTADVTADKDRTPETTNGCARATNGDCADARSAQLKHTVLAMLTMTDSDADRPASTFASGPRLACAAVPLSDGEWTRSDGILSALRRTCANGDVTVPRRRVTDRTKAIAQGFADADRRIRMVMIPEHTGAVESHTFACALVATEAKDRSIIGANDGLVPNCHEQMVKVAEPYPSAGLTRWDIRGRRRERTRDRHGVFGASPPAFRSRESPRPRDMAPSFSILRRNRGPG